MAFNTVAVACVALALHVAHVRGKDVPTGGTCSPWGNDVCEIFQGGGSAPFGGGCKGRCCTLAAHKEAQCQTCGPAGACSACKNNYALQTDGSCKRCASNEFVVGGSRCVPKCYTNGWPKKCTTACECDPSDFSKHKHSDGKGCFSCKTSPPPLKTGQATPPHMHA